MERNVVIRRSRQPSEETEEYAHIVIDAAFEVHKALGPGYSESVYEQALCYELELRGVPFVRQFPVAVTYKGKSMGEGRLDLLVGDDLVVELKAIETLGTVHTAQVISYLKATGHVLGLLINFNVATLKSGIRRIIYSNSNKT